MSKLLMDVVDGLGTRGEDWDHTLPGLGTAPHLGVRSQNHLVFPVLPLPCVQRPSACKPDFWSFKVQAGGERVSDQLLKATLGVSRLKILKNWISQFQTLSRL